MRYAILLPVELEELQNGICDLMDVFAVDPVIGNLISFATKDDAEAFMQENGVDGEIIQLYM